MKLARQTHLEAQRELVLQTVLLAVFNLFQALSTAELIRSLAL